jgi:polar amino acid transport system substrate-binding protein
MTARRGLAAGWMAGLLVLATGCGRDELVIARLDDARHARIGVMTGATGEVVTRARLPEADIKSFDDIMDAAAAMKAGQLDATVISRPAALQMVKHNPEFELVAEPLDQEDTAVALRKRDTALLAAVNRFIASLRADGTLADMSRRWFKPDLAPYAEPAIAVPATGEVLNVGVSATREPMSFVDRDGRVTGHDGELARRLGAWLGRPVVFHDMKFMALIPALESRKVDVIVTGMTATDERRRQVAFSEPYYVNAQVMIVRKPAARRPAPAAGDIATAPPGGRAPGATPSILRQLADSFEANLVREKRYRLILGGLRTTVVISVLATLFGTVLGGLICFMRMSRRALLRGPARVYIDILRGTPVLVVLMLVFYVVFAAVDINPVLVAVIAFGLNFAAYVAEIFRSGIEGVDKGQTEAGLSLGFTKPATFLHIVLPQTVRRILPVYKGEFISLVKMTSIVGYIAVQDLTKASDIIRSRTFDPFFPLVMVAILYFTISWALLQALTWIERRTDPKLRRRREVRA